MQIAVKRLRLPDGTILTNQILFLDASGRVQRYEPLTCEHPFTIWRRGTYNLTNNP